MPDQDILAMRVCQILEEERVEAEQGKVADFILRFGHIQINPDDTTTQVSGERHIAKLFKSVDRNLN